jgi:hypothetical protein
MPELEAEERGKRRVTQKDPGRGWQPTLGSIEPDTLQNIR